MQVKFTQITNDVLEQGILKAADLAGDNNGLVSAEEFSSYIEQFGGLDADGLVEEANKGWTLYVKADERQDIFQRISSNSTTEPRKDRAIDPGKMTWLEFIDGVLSPILGVSDI